MMAKLAEVLRTEPEQCCAVELGVSPDVVVDLRLELAAVPVVPALLGEVLRADEHRFGLPVVALSGQERASFQPEHLHAVRGEPVPEGPAARAGPDDDNVVVLVVCHAEPSRSWVLPVVTLRLPRDTRDCPARTNDVITRRG